MLKIICSVFLLQQSCSWSIRFNRKHSSNTIAEKIMTRDSADLGLARFGYKASRCWTSFVGTLLAVDTSQEIVVHGETNSPILPENSLEIIPVINKIDLPAPTANPELVMEKVENTRGLDCSGAIETSQKTSHNILKSDTHKINPPTVDYNTELSDPIISEEFKTVEEFENYEVSNSGIVRNKKTNRILKPSLDPSGYPKVLLCNTKTRKTFKLHQLIAKAFVPNPNNRICVNHIDKNKLNNNFNNLRWATHQEYNRNRNMIASNTSGVKGVYFHKTSKKWMAYIGIDKTLHYIGLFDNIEDAKAARQKQSKSCFGEFQNPCERN